LNAGLVNAAIKNGATFLILNPLDEVIMNAVNAAGLLFKGEMPTVPFYDKKKPLTLSRKTSLTQAIISGDVQSSIEIGKKLLDSGISAQKLIDNYISKAMKIVGDYYEKGKFFIPDLLKAAEASKAVLDRAKKDLPQEKRRGRIVLATVKGDIHDIGKNIVAMIFESTGYEVIDLGKDVAVEKIIKTIKKDKVDALGLSALLTTTMPEMGHVVRELRKARIDIRVIIGGPNVSEDYAKKIGAFGAAKNVLEGLRLLKKIKSVKK
jgi:5-methyltetrahydrofolate--homocysteine methyltransferase